MSGNFIVLDAGAVQNLYAGGGQAAWDQLLKGGNQVIFSSVIREELASAPSGIGTAFNDWISANGIPVVDFELPDLRRADGTLRTDAGDKVLRALMDHQNNPDAVTALQRAGISTSGRFRLLTDDSGFLRTVYVETGSFSADGLAGKGHGVEPYRGTAEFMAERYALGDIDKPAFRSWLDTFRASDRYSRLTAEGVNDGTGGKQFKLQQQFDLIHGNPDLLEGNVLDNIRDARRRILNDSAGSVSPNFALKGGILAGSGYLLAKFGIIGDILAFSMVASTADELRKTGDPENIKAANKLWVSYVFETAGGLAGAAVGGYVAAATLKGFGGFWGPLVGAVAGSVAGSYAGAELGEYIYDQYPDIFDDLINSVYDGFDMDLSLGDGIDTDGYARELFRKLGFTLDPNDTSDAEDWVLGTKWAHVAGGKGDDFLLGWNPEFVRSGETFDEDIKAQAAAAWAAYDALVALGQSPQPPTLERTAGVAQEDMRQVLDGGEGNDWVITIGGEKAITAGGLGRDWIFNSSSEGELWGDYASGVNENGERAEDVSANADNFWYFPDTVIMDAQHYDVLKFFGIPLTGGDAAASMVAFALGARSGSMAVVTGVLGAANMAAHATGNSVYFDHLLPFITYKRDGDDLLVGNVFDGFFRAVTGQDGIFNVSDGSGGDVDVQGVQRIRNFDLVSGMWGFQNGMATIDSQDAVWADLQVWRGLDQDGTSDAGELVSLEALGIVSLSLSGTVSAANDNQAIVLLAA